LISIVTISKDAKDWSLLNEQVQLLSKKHGQLKQAITKMVQVVMGFLDDTPSLETKLNTIETLRTVTEGKVSRIERHCSSHRIDHGFYRSSSKSSEHASRRFCRISSEKRVM
jgi:hypothetical protein